MSAQAEEVRLVHLDRSLAESLADPIIELEKELPWTPWTREQYLSDRPGKWHLSSAALAGEKVVGVLIVSRPDHRTAHFHRLVVARSARGRGLGARLMRFSARRAAAAGATVLTLKVEESNSTAQRLHEGLGFAKVSEANGHWLMSARTEALAARGEVGEVGEVP